VRREGGDGQFDFVRDQNPQPGTPVPPGSEVVLIVE
jgi:hypothetical protein